MWEVFNKGCGISLLWLDYFNCNIRSWGKRRPKSRALDAPLTSPTPKTGGRKAFLGDCGRTGPSGAVGPGLLSVGRPLQAGCAGLERRGRLGFRPGALPPCVAVCPLGKTHLSVSSFHPSTARPVNPIEPCITPGLV